jgi:hypothetical protein
VQELDRGEHWRREKGAKRVAKSGSAQASTNPAELNTTEPGDGSRGLSRHDVLTLS